jgi:hypothetical protein
MLEVLYKNHKKQSKTRNDKEKHVCIPVFDHQNITPAKVTLKMTLGIRV